MELEGDGHYFVNVPDLEIKQTYGYYTGGGPLEDRMVITIQDDDISVEFKND